MPLTPPGGPARARRRRRGRGQRAPSARSVTASARLGHVADHDRRQLAEQRRAGQPGHPARLEPDGRQVVDLGLPGRRRARLHQHLGDRAVAQQVLGTGDEGERGAGRSAIGATLPAAGDRAGPTVRTPATSDRAVPVGAPDDRARCGAARQRRSAPGARSRCPPRPTTSATRGRSRREQRRVLVGRAVVGDLEHVDAGRGRHGRAAPAAPAARRRR